jgi:trans-aconitate methyltransferase
VKTWQESWERLMEAYQPNREQGIQAVLDLVEAAVDTTSPRILDLGGGTGSVGRRAIARWPQARVTLLDIDPVLMAIAEVGPPGLDVVRSDLRQPGWTTGLPDREFDAVLAVMALHYLPPDRLAAVYAEVAGVLRPGGLLVAVEHMPDPGLPRLSRRILERAAASHRDGPGWDDWWARAAADPVLGPAWHERAMTLTDLPSAEWTPPAAWHVEALEAAGYAEVGLGWRHGPQAAVVAVAGDDSS